MFEVLGKICAVDSWPYGSFINDVTQLGGEGVSKCVTQCDRWVGGGSLQRDVTLRCTYYLLFLIDAIVS